MFVKSYSPVLVWYCCEIVHHFEVLCCHRCRSHLIVLSVPLNLTFRPYYNKGWSPLLFDFDEILVLAFVVLILWWEGSSILFYIHWTLAPRFDWKHRSCLLLLLIISLLKIGWKGCLRSLRSYPLILKS